MTDHRRLPVFYDAEARTLDASVYVDDGIYQRELAQVFERSWLFLGHESQIPNAGDYVTTWMGEDPIVVSRQHDGTIAAFLNVCRHRGMVLCRSDGGNASSFSCSYHGWTYDTAGQLIAIPSEEELFKCPVDRAKWSAHRVPRLASYRGFLFGNWSPDAPSFEEHIEDIRWHLDPIFDGIEGVELLPGVEKWSVKANWKLGADQFVTDNFHFPTTHAAGFAVSMNQRPEVAARMRPPTPKDSRHARSRYGHGIGYSTDPEWQDMRIEMTLGRGVREYLAGPHRAAMIRKYGPIAGAHVGVGHGLLFPNFGFLGVGTIRVFHPKGPDAMEIWNYTMVPKHAPTALKERWRIDATHAFGAAGIFEQEDGENWMHIQESLRGRRARGARHNLQMGRDVADPRFPGTTEAADTEAGGRAFYARWSELMTDEGETP